MTPSGTLTDDGRFLPTHLSASQFALYDLCPVLYRERYVLNLFPPPQPERLFGIAVHQGLEALFRGNQAYEQVFLIAWRRELETIDTTKFAAIGNLRARGLDLLDQVRQLGLEGEPERRVTLTWPGFSVPIVGFADLWGPGVVVDFKTAGYGWPQSKAAAQVFQPAIYSAAHVLESEDGEIPQFKFVVLPRVQAPIQILDATRNDEQIVAAFDRARAIHLAIENQQWGCTCRGRFHLFDPDYELGDT